MHQYGEQGYCLLWAINNSLQRKILTKDGILKELKGINERNKTHNSRYYMGDDGLDFKSFKAIIKRVFGIYLKRVKTYKLVGSYILTYDFGDYYHTVGMIDGEILDSRKHSEIKSLDTKVPLVDVYKVVR